MKITLISRTAERFSSSNCCSCVLLLSWYSFIHKIKRFCTVSCMSVSMAIIISAATTHVCYKESSKNCRKSKRGGEGCRPHPCHTSQTSRQRHFYRHGMYTHVFSLLSIFCIPTLFYSPLQPQRVPIKTSLAPAGKISFNSTKSEGAIKNK